MRISDWSSDVCSSDLPEHLRARLSLRLAGRAVADATSERRADLRAPRQRLRALLAARAAAQPLLRAGEGRREPGRLAGRALLGAAEVAASRRGRRPPRHRRSDEHTSELQSLMRISN